MKEHTQLGFQKNTAGIESFYYWFS